MDTLNLLVRSKAFWIALFLLFQGFGQWLVPSIPANIWALADSLVGVIATIIAGQEVVAKTRALRAARALKAPK